MSSSTATQILFNSPALHSLKRDQLVKLCKTHALKANGKNVDLIERLKQHAVTLPKDAPLSIAVRGEFNDAETINDEDEPMPQEEPMDQDLSGFSNSMPRPSEQWEMVMDSIAEEEEGSSKGSLSSLKTIGNGHKGTAGEFGTGSSKSSTVGSSFRALASSFGLKRAGTTKSTASSKPSIRSTLSKVTNAASPPTARGELEETASPYSALPQSQPVQEIKPLAFNPARMSMNGFLTEGETPLPGHALRPGLPAPENARLSMGLGLGAPATPQRAQPTTTIRLVGQGGSGAATTSGNPPSYAATPRLKPMETTFDLIMGSPMGSPTAGNSWPAFGNIYPTLTFADLPPSLPTPSASPVRNQQMPATPSALERQKSPDPFIFGSPHPKHRVSNVQFKSAAASVLEEMNKRLQDEGVATVDNTIIERLHPGASQQMSPRDVKPLPARAGGEIKGKFDSMHEKEFSKMEGIDGTLKRKAERAAQKEEAPPALVVGKKRKSSVIGDNGARRPGVIAGRRVSGTRVISNGRRAKALPGAFGPVDDDDDEEEEADIQPDEPRAGKRIRVSTNPIDNSAPTRDTQDEDEEEKWKQREAIRKKLEMNKRRRSSLAAAKGRRSSRVSGGLLQPKPKASRFGFLASAKSLVQNVWNRNKPAAAPAPKPSTLVKPPPQSKAPIDVTRKAAVAPARPVTATATATTKLAEPTRGTASSSARSRSPIPSFGTPASRSSIAAKEGTQSSRMSLLVATAASKKNSMATGHSRTSSTNVSSIGTRTSVDRVTSPVGSMGTQRFTSPPIARTPAMGSASSRPSVAGRASNAGSSSSRLSTTSRLLAPTASSLAKINRNSMAGLKPVAEQPSRLRLPSPPQHTPQPALVTITNAAAAMKSPTPFSPTRGSIFSKPLQLTTSIPTPMKKRVTSGLSAAPIGTDVKATGPESAQPTVARQRSVVARKPRISRSKVIARLASQRAAGSSSSSSSSSNPAVPAGTSVLASKPGGRTRSSLGAKAHRSSLGGPKTRTSGGGDMLMSAKKKARQSEYMRRKSRVDNSTFSPGNAMDVDG